MKRLCLLILSVLLFHLHSVSNDSIYFYKADQLIYSQSIRNIDSLTFNSFSDYRYSRSLEVLEILQKDQNTNMFASWVVLAGLQYNLDSATLWVPDNTSMMSYDHITDVEYIRKFVQNHISNQEQRVYFNSNQSKSINMKSGKILHLQMGTEPTLNNVKIISPNQIAARSMIHIMHGAIPYQDNLWEYITQRQGHQKMSEFFNSHNTLKYDPTQGVDVLYNPLKEIYPFLMDETQANTVFIPDDAAWDAAWHKLFPYYGDQTSRAIIQKLFFYGEVKPDVQDTVLTTYSSHKIINPERLFPGTEQIKLSNGLIYKASNLHIYDFTDINDHIIVEAEDEKWGRVHTNYRPEIIAHYSDSLVMSENHYLDLIATSTLSAAVLSVIVPIPNTIIGKYNVYCVFVPSNLRNADDLRPYKAVFSFINGAKEEFIGANNDFVSLYNNAKQHITNPTGLTKVLVYENYEFDKANVVLSPFGLTLQENSVDFKIRMRNAAGTSASERLNFSRDIALDYIILEKVE